MTTDQISGYLGFGWRKFSGVLEMFFILTGVVVTRGHTFVKKHQTALNMSAFYFMKFLNLLKGY